MEDGGYITEEMDSRIIDEGGQLKTKNGQKYIVNPKPDGWFIPRLHAVIICVLTIIVMILIILLTYFTAISSCSGNHNHTSIAVNESSNVSKAGFLSLESGYTQSDQSDDQIDEKSDQEIEFNEGWSPVLYKLIIEPDFNTSSSNGDIWIDIIKDSKENEILPIVLDINNITISETKVFLNAPDNPILLNVKTVYGENNSTFIITIVNGTSLLLDVNTTLQVQLKFVSQLTDTLQGFYRTSHYDAYTKEKRWLASTQFSPIDARRAFPCFDRPDKKAQFQISVIRPDEKSMALSNMPSVHTWIPKSGFIQEDFDITPKMSSYIVAFIVSDLIKTNTSIELNKTVPLLSIWSRKEVKDMTGYAYAITTKILPFFEEYFDIPFKLPKIDMVAVPDFGFQAMENWGLITFRESALLVPQDPERQSSAEHTESVTSVVAHELAHQWFGNLVTMKWWEDLWLKEGFATYMSYLAIQQIEPSWQILDFFSINELQKAMGIDSDSFSHPISFPVSKPADIRRIFDPISYSKGACLLRMMNNFLGERAFIKALRDYLKTFAFSNAVQDDLWDFMTKYGHIYEILPKEYNVKEIMDTWTIQAGYPIVTVIRNGTDIVISQQRYMLPEIEKDDSQKWFIPITFETNSIQTHDDVPFYWLDNVKEKRLSNVIDPNDWLYVNVKRTGYYRVNYDYNSWVILSRNYDILPDVTKAQLIDDAMNLARAEVLSYDIPLTFLVKLYGKYEYILPWSAATSGINYLTNMLIREPAYEHFKAIMLHIIKPIYAHMGFDETSNESHVELMHRRVMVQHACFFGYDRCTNRAQLFFREWMREKSQNFLSPNLKEVIYCTALREGSLHEWYFAYNRYLATPSASEKEIILNALGCTSKPWLLSKYLNMTISSTSGIRKQDGARAFTSVAKNNLGYEIAFDFLVSNIQQISEYFGDGFSTISKMISSLTTFMNKKYQLEQFEKFAAKARELNITSIETSIDMALEQVKINVFWRSRSYYKLAKYLESLTSQQHISLD